MLVLASYIDATTTGIGLAEGTEDKKRGHTWSCENDDGPAEFWGLLKMTTKSAGAFILSVKQKLTVRTRYLATPRTVEFIPNNPFHVALTSVTKKAANVPGHPAPSHLTERYTVLLNMLDRIDTNSLDAQIESANVCLIYKRQVTTDNVGRQRKL